MHESDISYMCGDTRCQGFVVRDDSWEGVRPAVLVVHQFFGPGEYERMRARMLAEAGYVAFVADIYGAEVRPRSREEASTESGKFRADLPLLRQRVQAALNTMLRQDEVDKSRTAAIGYCFGGRAVLELARAGAELGGVVSFHGGLATPDPAQPGEIRCKVLALHGADDPFITGEHVQSFVNEMRACGADWQLVHYGGAVHSFTERGAGDDPTRGAAYHELADSRSWLAMRSFFDEIFSAG